ncbi:MAG TPA: amidase [Thermodesulfobacteriota bacterium]|nr:amidase [Thermodesulfobacteriota bacterium]
MKTIPANERTVASISRLIRRKEISPLEAARFFLDRIEEHDAKTNSFITVLPDLAVKAARRAEKEIVKGKYRGPLHGIPFAAKDLFFTRGIRTTCGSKILKNFVPEYDATVISRLYDAGAILLGKLNMHEFAYGTTTVNPHYGAVRNPWDLSRVPGGSSGGSAAAVAASLVPLTLGTDTGGSIRIPSALCGTAGLKPTYGRISRHGVYPLSWSMDHPGPMARTVEDLALSMRVLAGADPHDPSASAAAVPDYSKSLGKDLKGIRVAVPANYYFENVDPGVEQAVRGAVKVLKRLGANIRNVLIPGLPEAAWAASVTLFSEGAASLEKWHRTRPADLGGDVRSRLNLGAAIMATQYLRAQRVRRKTQEIFASVFEKADVVVTPQLPVTAPKLDQGSVAWKKESEPVPSALTRFTRIFNLIGIPSLCLSCGFSSAGMPIGLQIAGRPFEEALVLRVGFAYERETPWKERHPDM